MSPRDLMLLLATVYLLVTVGLASGCNSRDRRVSRVDRPHHAVAMQRPIVYRGGEPVPAIPAAGERPWYVDRNDRYPSVTAGVRSAVVSRSVTRTYDRFEIRNGRADDDFIQRRRTIEVVESVR